MTVMALPGVERVAHKVHEAWMAEKRDRGVRSRKPEWGEELMVPYAQLSERAKDLNRTMVQTVYLAITEALE